MPVNYFCRLIFIVTQIYLCTCTSTLNENPTNEEVASLNTILNHKGWKALATLVQDEEVRRNLVGQFPTSYPSLHHMFYGDRMRNASRVLSSVYLMVLKKLFIFYKDDLGIDGNDRRDSAILNLAKRSWIIGWTNPLIECMINGLTFFERQAGNVALETLKQIYNVFKTVKEKCNDENNRTDYIMNNKIVNKLLKYIDDAHSQFVSRDDTIDFPEFESYVNTFIDVFLNMKDSNNYINLFDSNFENHYNKGVELFCSDFGFS